MMQVGRGDRTPTPNLWGFPLFSQPLGTPMYSGPWSNPAGAEKGKRNPMGWGCVQPRVLPSTSKNQVWGTAWAANWSN